MQRRNRKVGFLRENVNAYAPQMQYLEIPSFLYSWKYQLLKQLSLNSLNVSTLIAMMFATSGITD
jgi:hypothetical protein